MRLPRRQMVNLISPVSKPLKSSVPKHFAIVLIIGLAALGACIVASLAFGSRVVGIKDMMDGLFNPGADSFGASVMHQRVARTVFSLCCGGALGIAGSLMQAVTRN